jgi:hypothetical protein
MNSAREIANAAKPADIPEAARSSPAFGGPAQSVHSASDARTVNNVMRHEYRVLSDAEKIAMQKVKDLGLQMHGYFDSLGTSREMSVAKTKIEEAVMWAVKHLTR